MSVVKDHTHNNTDTQHTQTHTPSHNRITELAPWKQTGRHYQSAPRKSRSDQTLTPPRLSQIGQRGLSVIHRKDMNNSVLARTSILNGIPNRKVCVCVCVCMCVFEQV